MAEFEATGSEESKAKKVSFGDVEVRKYQMILGDNPGTRKGLPLTIAWKHFESQVEELDVYQARQDGKKKKRRKPSRLKWDYRLEYLTSLGAYDGADFLAVLTECAEIRESRMKNAGEENADAFNDFFATSTKAFKRSSALALGSVVNAGQSTINTAVNAGKITTDAVVKAGKVTTNHVVNAGRVTTNAVIDAGKITTHSVVNAGKITTGAVVKAGKASTNAVVGAGKATTQSVVTGAKRTGRASITATRTTANAIGKAVTMPADWVKGVGSRRRSLGASFPSRRRRSVDNASKFTASSSDDEDFIPHSRRTTSVSPPPPPRAVDAAAKTPIATM